MHIDLLYKIINFAIFFGLLYFFLRRPLQEFWRSRSETLRHQIDTAREHRATAEARYNELSARMTQIQSEVKELRDKLEGDGRLEKDHIISNAKAYGTRLEEAGEKIGGQDAIKVRYRLQQLGARMSVELAERLVSDGITKDDQERLISDYLAKLGKKDFQLMGGGTA